MSEFWIKEGGRKVPWLVLEGRGGGGKESVQTSVAQYLGARGYPYTPIYLCRCHAVFCSNGHDSLILQDRPLNVVLLQLCRVPQR